MIAGHIDQTIANVLAHQGLFVAVIFRYLINFIGDVVIAWALYFLLLPTNRAVSLTDSAGSSTALRVRAEALEALGNVRPATETIESAIAARLGISPRTVDNHVASIFNRLSIRARWQLTSDLLDRA